MISNRTPTLKLLLNLRDELFEEEGDLAAYLDAPVSRVGHLSCLNNL